MDNKRLVVSRIVRCFDLAKDTVHFIQGSILTAWLFTCADLKTILFPSTAFAMAATSISSPFSVFQAFCWTWIHLLQANVSNQARSRDEDLINKPWRPLPSNRISETDVMKLRWTLVGFCLVISAPFGAVPASAFLTMTTYLHDDLFGSSHWLTKTILNSFGYFSFEVGATQIVGGCQPLTFQTTVALVCSAVTILLTIHTQDFADIAGDLKSQRKTVPIVFSNSRTYMLCTLTLWPIVLCYIQAVRLDIGVAFTSLGFYVGTRLFFLREERSDTKTYVIYNFWLIWAHLLPLLRVDRSLPYEHITNILHKFAVIA